MYFRVVWSPVEVEYLKKNKDVSINQLTVALAKSRSAIQKKLRELETGIVEKPNKKRSNIGKRKDCNGLFFRSGWEANCYRYLTRQENIRLVEYEPTTFSFTSFGILKGTVSYTPDFKITYTDGSYRWLEVKGNYLKTQDITKLKRFKKYFPEEFSKLICVPPSPTSKTTKIFIELGIEVLCHYNELNKCWRNIIPNWE